MQYIKKNPTYFFSYSYQDQHQEEHFPDEGVSIFFLFFSF